MGIFDDILKENNEWKETLVKDLIIMSMVDGDVDAAEMDVLAKIAIELDIDPIIIENIFSDINSVESIYPDNLDDKYKYIKYLSQLIIADGKIDNQEIEYLINISEKLNIDRTIVNDLIKNMNYNLEDNSRYELTNEDDNVLISRVAKQNNLQEGIFANINNDLSEAMEKLGYSSSDEITYEAKLVLMSGAYARRAVAAGLVLQGVFSIQDFQHAQKMFQNTQISTIHSREFQERASYIAYKFIQSYDSRLTIEMMVKILTPVMQNHNDDVGTAKDLGIQYSYEDIVS